jgi:hypothetical protein
LLGNQVKRKGSGLDNWEIFLLIQMFISNWGLYCLLWLFLYLILKTNCGVQLLKASEHLSPDDGTGIMAYV